ncbi:hypothetical protein [Roseobacter sp. MH60115]|nr:hypothetical protein [Roseobacter sp. MH60115]
MSDLQEKTDKRHARLFELIRQRNQAEATVARVQGHTVRRLSANEAVQLQRAAARSLQARMETPLH